MKQTLNPEYLYYCHSLYAEELADSLNPHQINISESSTVDKQFSLQRFLTKLWISALNLNALDARINVPQTFPQA